MVYHLVGSETAHRLTMESITCHSYLGPKEGGGGVVGCVESREMDESLNPSLCARLGNHPRPLLVHVSELEVPEQAGRQVDIRVLEQEMDGHYNHKS